MAPLLRILLLIVGAWLVVSLLAYLLQRKLQYFPDTGELPLPGEARYRGVRDVRLETSDGVTIRAWHWPGTRETTLLVFHGNAGHRGHRLEWFENFHDLGWGVFLLDYRGYGGSEGSPTEEGLCRDGDAAMAHLREQGVESVVFFGESIGCSVAVDVAVRTPPAALVLQSGAISLVEVARSAYPFLPVGLLMKDRFESGDKIAKIPCPLLSIHGSRDRIVPKKLGKALFEAAPGEKEWHEVKGAGHNDIPWIGGRAYYERIHAFLERVTKGR